MEVPDQSSRTGKDDRFKSPVRLLLNFFLKSRDRWRDKAIQRRTKIKNLEHKMRDIDDSRANWKSKAEQSEADQQALQERLRIVEAERDELRAKLEELQSKKAARSVDR
jgi:septal ring factor EnvC (AmiA/AmiB activator)